jgi:hypothetical protein
MNLPVHAGYTATLEDGSRIVKSAVATEFRKAKDRSDCFARQRHEDGGELSVVGSNGEPARIVVEVCQTAENRFRAAKHGYAVGLALAHALPDEFDYLKTVVSQ